VDRVEFVVIPDQSTAVAALEKGEVDYVQRPHMDQWPLLRKNANIAMYRSDVSQMQIHPNHLNPPFDNVKARQALMAMVNQEEYLRAIAGDPENFRICHSMTGCAGWLETDAGADLLKKQDFEKAKQLMAEAGYKGEKIVVMAPSDFAPINAASLTTAAMLRKIGVNVDLQVVDWGTLVSRRGVKEPPSKNPGGYSFHLLRSRRRQGPVGHANISTAATRWFVACIAAATKALNDWGSSPEPTPFKKGPTTTAPHGECHLRNYEFFQINIGRPLSGIPNAPHGVRNLVKKQVGGPSGRPPPPSRARGRSHADHTIQSPSGLPVLGIVGLRLSACPPGPGDPATILAGDYATPENIQKIRTGLGLDRPIHVQFAIYAGNLLRGDLGKSLHSQMPVGQFIL
jgi:hypothetical protein